MMHRLHDYNETDLRNALQSPYISTENKLEIAAEIISRQDTLLDKGEWEYGWKTH